MPPSVWTAESDRRRSGRLPFRHRLAGASSCLGVAPSLSRASGACLQTETPASQQLLSCRGCDCPPETLARYCCRFGSNRGLESCLSDGTESHGRRSVWSLDPGAIASAARLCVCHPPRWAYHPGSLPCSGRRATARRGEDAARRSCATARRGASLPAAVVAIARRGAPTSWNFSPLNAQGSAVARVRPDQSDPI